MYDGAKSSNAAVADLRRRYGHLDGLALLTALSKDQTTGRIALVSSFGAESAILLDMVATIDPLMPVIFLDTGKLFPETLVYREMLTRRLGLADVRIIQPDGRDLQASDPDGTLWSQDPDRCCVLRKAEPLKRALMDFDAWITGRKRFHGNLRQSLATIDGDTTTGKVKINPLATWSHATVLRYLAERELPAHPLVRDGFSSIGCLPCTRPTSPGEAVRAGRWSWLEKSECGIHRY